MYIIRRDKDGRECLSIDMLKDYDYKVPIAFLGLSNFTTFLFNYLRSDVNSTKSSACLK